MLAWPGPSPPLIPGGDCCWLIRRLRALPQGSSSMGGLYSPTSATTTREFRCPTSYRGSS